MANPATAVNLNWAAENLKIQLQQQQSPPHFINSVTELRDLSTAISAFQRRYDELQEHLNFIRSAIDSKWPEHLDAGPSPPQQLTKVPATTIVPLTDRTETLASDTPASPPQQLAIVPAITIVPLTETPASNTPASPPQQLATVPAATIVPLTETLTSDNTIVPAPESANSEQKTDNKQSSRSEVEFLCEKMSSRGLRKYMVMRLSNIAKLREEVTEALKLAPKPAKLVLECLGRFYFQGRKAYTTQSPMITARQASVLVLECFLLRGCNDVVVEPAVKEEADAAAVAWKKRLVSEGGVSTACEIDARGLLLFLACFGIPHAFTNGDVRDLFRPSNAKEISHVLRRSNVLLARIPEIIERMIKDKMEVEAVDVACTFGLEDRFPPQSILTLFLQESKEAWKRKRKAAHGSFTAENEANKKHLADLKSVTKCLEDHKIDTQKLLPGWKINEKITTLKKDIADIDKKTGETVMLKRKADETKPSKKVTTQEEKRLRSTGHGPQDFGHADSRSSYDNLGPMNFLDGGFPSHASTYTASPSILHGYGAGFLPENIIGPVAGSRSGVLAAGAGVGVGMSTGTGGLMPMGSIAGQVMNHDGQPYGWHGDAAFHERLIGHSFAGQPASIGVNGLYRPSSSSLEGFAEPVPIGVNGLYRPSSSSLEGFAGLPNHSSVGVSNRSSTSDLYQFADAVLESESYRSSGSRPGVPAPAHRSSYLY